MKIDIMRAIIPDIFKTYILDKNEKLSKKLFIYSITMNGGKLSISDLNRLSTKNYEMYSETWDLPA